MDINLVSAGGTAIVSTAGTITSIAIGRTGSGYRQGSQTVNVGVYTSSIGRTGIEFIGTAAVSNGHIVSVAITNPGSGYQVGSEPVVVFDAPLSYSNIPLVYSDESPVAGTGTEATIDIVVGQGSSVIDFEIRNFGYRYGQKQVLTVATGVLQVFQLIQIIHLMNSKSLSIKLILIHSLLGTLENLSVLIISILNLMELEDNSQLKNGSPVTVRARAGSNIDVKSTLLIFVNDILQVPGEAYEFNGGSVINFSEPPKGISDDGSYSGDTCKILFYKGSGDVDITFRDVLPTLKDGDDLSIRGDNDLVSDSVDQGARLITEVLSTDTVETNPYSGRGIDSNPDHARTVTWCKQTVDKVINGKIISKARELNAFN